MTTRVVTVANISLPRTHLGKFCSISTNSIQMYNWRVAAVAFFTNLIRCASFSLVLLDAYIHTTGAFDWRRILKRAGKACVILYETNVPAGHKSLSYLATRLRRLLWNWNATEWSHCKRAINISGGFSILLDGKGREPSVKLTLGTINDNNLDTQIKHQKQKTLGVSRHDTNSTHKILLAITLHLCESYQK